MQYLRANIRHKAAKCNLLTVGEGLQAGSAVDEVHADRHEAEHQAEDDTGVELLPNALADVGAALFGALRVRFCRIGRSSPTFCALVVRFSRIGRSGCAGIGTGLVEPHDAALLVETCLLDRDRCATCLQSMLFRNGIVNRNRVIAIIGNRECPLTVGISRRFSTFLTGQRDGSARNRPLVGILQNAIDTTIVGSRIAHVDGFRSHRSNGREYEKHRENGKNRTKYCDSRSTMPFEIRYGCHWFFLSCCFHNVGEETDCVVALRFLSRYSATARVT